jgi:hypothetical protein
MDEQQVEGRLRDIDQVLQFLLQQVQPSDGVAAAMKRLREGVTTPEVARAERLEALKARRSALIPKSGHHVASVGFPVMLPLRHIAVPREPVAFDPKADLANAVACPFSARGQ